jgi:hypothetical protein
MQKLPYIVPAIESNTLSTPATCDGISFCRDFRSRRGIVNRMTGKDYIIQDSCVMECELTAPVTLQKPQGSVKCPKA